MTLAVLAAAGCWAVADLRINVATFVDSAHNAADFAGRMFPLDFPTLPELLALTGQTMSIVVSATLLSVIISVPLAILAAANTTPGHVSRYGARTLIVVVRAVPDVVPAIIFFRIFGLGSMTGVLAMGVHSVGMVAKLYADAIEQIDEGPRSAVRAGGASSTQELIVGVLPQVLPAFVATALHRLDINLRISVQIALGATVIGAALALPIGALAARNVAPTPRTAHAFRLLVVVIRGIPELVLAVVFVVVTGLGAVAGTLALAVGAVGLLGKLIADSLEEVDAGPEQAVRATGAARRQVFCTGTLPQAAPALVGHVLYQLDVNIRSATLLGIVGAGGIGFDLLSAAQIVEFGLVTTILLLVFATVLIVEALALWLRHELR